MYDQCRSRSAATGMVSDMDLHWSYLGQKKPNKPKSKQWRFWSDGTHVPADLDLHCSSTPSMRIYGETISVTMVIWAHWRFLKHHKLLVVRFPSTTSARRERNCKLLNIAVQDIKYKGILFFHRNHFYTSWKILSNKFLKIHAWFPWRLR
jgi:hypothetical protein